MTNENITIPVQATYRVQDNTVSQIAAEYVDVSADVVARFLLQAFNVPMEKGAKW